LISRKKNEILYKIKHAIKMLRIPYLKETAPYGG